MNRHRQIVEQYRKAAEDERIYLYLDCPALREAFIEIDRTEAMNVAVENRSGKKQAHKFRRTVSAMLSDCCGLF
ncbi:MAG: hypothetical protein HKM93_11670 [Desulfobacteraceae bacterium]|nr:hypothetical protein [Desulfobacteraceae bacterium]